MATYGVAADLILAPRGTGDEVLARHPGGGSARKRPAHPGSGRHGDAGEFRADRHRLEADAASRARGCRGAAVPLRAREIVVVTVEEPGVERPGERPGERDQADRLVQNLAWHGIAATTLRLKPGPEGAAATLLAGIGDRADLLVMGGYGHGRLREWVFGGFTRLVLADAPLPVLIAH